MGVFKAALSPTCALSSFVFVVLAAAYISLSGGPPGVDYPLKMGGSGIAAAHLRGGDLRLPIHWP
jgi:hypothetical protein